MCVDRLQGQVNDTQTTKKLANINMEAMVRSYRPGCTGFSSGSVWEVITLLTFPQYSMIVCKNRKSVIRFVVHKTIGDTNGAAFFPV